MSNRRFRWLSDMLGLNSQQPQPQGGSLSLGVSGWGQPAPAQQNPWPQQTWGQQPQQMGAMGAFAAGAGVPQQPVAPPSELEMQIMLLRGIVPVDRFIASPQMGVLVEMFNNIVSFSVLEILKNAVFVADDDGSLKMEITSLPQHLQTMSAENVKADFTALQSAAQQNIQNAEGQQMQLNNMASQSMMNAALTAAMDQGVMEKAGGFIGNTARSFITGGR